jgi:hypothetical protein
MARVWKIAPGVRADNWSICRDHGCIALGWDQIGNFRRYRTRDEVVEALACASDVREGNRSGAARSIWRFVHVIREGDVIVANRGDTCVVGIGVVTGPYLHARHPDNPLPMYQRGEWWRRNARCVDWRVCFEASVHQRAFFVASTVTRLREAQCDDIRAAYAGADSGTRRAVGRLLTGVSHDEGIAAYPDATPEQLYAPFDPASVEDARDRVLATIVRRRGQASFRCELLKAYEGRCAVTRCGVVQILEAAHIVPYRGATTNHPANGILLRSDLHTLFDLGLLAVDEQTMQLVVSPSLAGTDYEKHRVKRLFLPRNPSLRPSPDAIRQHRMRSGL